MQKSECATERLCKELCNRIEGHPGIGGPSASPAAHRRSAVPKGLHQQWQPWGGTANFVSLGKLGKS